MQQQLFDLVDDSEEDEHKPVETQGPTAEQEEPETYKGLYAMHKYWSKKPHNLVANYIERYSTPGDIVLDSFCGSGVTLIESVRRERRGVGIDINPIAVRITEMGLKPIDVRELKQAYRQIESEVASPISEMYQMECPLCHDVDAIATHCIWEGQELREAWVECRTCKTRKAIKTEFSAEEIARIKSWVPSKWVPARSLIPNYRINVGPSVTVSDLFTGRALAGLSRLWDSIKHIDNTGIRAVMEACFTAMLPQASKLVFVIRRRGKNNNEKDRGRAEVGSWVIGYWLPQEYFEIHVWRCFENRFRRVLRGKEEVNKLIAPDVKQCRDFTELQACNKGYWVAQGSATTLSIPSESIDYAFIDPPHGNRIPYLELSLMWNAWLGVDAEWEDEVVVSEAKSRNKDIGDYEHRLSAAIQELRRVLKPARYLSIAFNSLDDDTWLALLNACLTSGFDVTDVRPLAYSARSVVQDTRKNALKTDFVVTCKKSIFSPARTITLDVRRADAQQVISKYLTEQCPGAQTYEVLNWVLVHELRASRAFRVSDILEVLESSFVYKSAGWYANGQKEE